MRAQLPRRHGGDLGVAEQDLALGRIDQAGDAARHRRLARARFAHDAQRLALADVEVDVDRGLHHARLLEEAAAAVGLASFSVRSTVDAVHAHAAVLGWIDGTEEISIVV